MAERFNQINKIGPKLCNFFLSIFNLIYNKGKIYFFKLLVEYSKQDIYRAGKKFGKFFDNRKIISNSLRSDHIRTNLIQINISDYTEFDSAQFPFLK